MKRPPLYTLLEVTGFRRWFARLYRLELHHGERVPASGPVILVANHESMIDPWILALATRRPVRYMAKAELFEYPVLRTIMRAFGTFPVERGTGDRAALGRAATLLDDGEVLGIFPQGTCLPHRNRPWHRGAARHRPRHRGDGRAGLHRRQRAGAPAAEVQARPAADQGDRAASRSPSSASGRRWRAPGR